MGVLDCVAGDPADYVRITVRLGTDRAWKQEVRAKIRASRQAIYEDAEVLRELEQFFLEAAGHHARQGSSAGPSN
jgi:predicted O-linked N-acetylglucosamine transferase (SPINDLY family)